MKLIELLLSTLSLYRSKYPIPSRKEKGSLLIDDSNYDYLPTIYLILLTRSSKTLVLLLAL